MRFHKKLVIEADFELKDSDFSFLMVTMPLSSIFAC